MDELRDGLSSGCRKRRCVVLCCVVVEKAVGTSVWKKTVMHIRGTNECSADVPLFAMMQ